MDIWFVKNKAFFYAEELISILYEVGEEIELNKQSKTFADSDVRALSDEFVKIINTKVSELKKDLQYRDSQFLEFFQLAIVAVIDDMFLTMNWDGRSYWSSYLLEMRFFSTRASGDIFFDNCKKILSRHDDKFKELAAIYHLALISGFRGKYLHSEYTEEINVVRTDLYNFFTNPEENQTVISEIVSLPTGYIENKSKAVLEKTYKINNILFLINLALIIVFAIASYFVWFHNQNLIFKNL